MDVIIFSGSPYEVQRDLKDFFSESKPSNFQLYQSAFQDKIIITVVYKK